METQTGHLLPSDKTKREKTPIHSASNIKTITRQMRRFRLLPRNGRQLTQKQNHSARLAQNKRCRGEQWLGLKGPERSCFWLVPSATAVHWPHGVGGQGGPGWPSVSLSVSLSVACGWSEKEVHAILCIYRDRRKLCNFTFKTRRLCGILIAEEWVKSTPVKCSFHFFHFWRHKSYTIY